MKRYLSEVESFLYLFIESRTLTRHDEKACRLVPANILVGSLFRRTGMFVGTSIFKGVNMSGALTRYDETGASNPCLCGILVVSKE